MLNITQRISLSKNARRLIKKRIKHDGGLNVDSWTNIPRTVKNEISKKLLFNHSPQCVYCERLLIATGNQVDHFAHKASFPQYTFTTTNLFYSCTYCNSSTRKGQKSTIDLPTNVNYRLCNFSIIHPLFENPDAEIIFQDADRIYFDRTLSSIKGNNTIDFFGWDDNQMTLLRARTLVNERLFPLTLIATKQLIQEIIAYKKK
jgi:uncharacterized protein (TIGR02646 family)